MSGKQLLVDTNILIYYFEGQQAAKDILEGKDIFVSVISEIELLGFVGLSSEAEREIREFLSGCHLVELTSVIRQRTISLRQSIRIKTPDAIIAATALEMDLPLASQDQGFVRVDGLEIIQL